uniref:C-type lectin domain-containing protein n=1 Tax=Gouania willdenowi TaxID=441366 RepID=A0A8C5E7J3_GOUWI
PASRHHYISWSELRGSQLDPNVFFVNSSETWPVAQKYCRENYVDLVTVTNIKVVKKIYSETGGSQVWIGLHRPPNFFWSDGIDANYRNWRSDQPDFNAAHDLCVSVRYVWNDLLCSYKAFFVCYNGSQLDPNVFFVNSSETWPVAQKYCRENYVDLVTVTNIKVVKKIYSETGGSLVWIGLHRPPNFFWSDGSNFTFSNWDSVRNKLNSMKVIWWSYSTCLQYHYVADQKTWTEAQTYCRQTYADLATIRNKEQNDQLLDTITSAGQSSEVWMGLYSTIDWRWSDGFSGVGANYSNWKHGQPDFYAAKEFCVVIGNVWIDVSCSSKWRFVCYNGENMKNQIFISIKYNHSVRILLSKTLMIVSTGSKLDPEVFFCEFL